MQEQKAWLDSLQRERTISHKDWNTAIVLSIFLGIVGADRFYVGRLDLGLLKLLTFGGYSIWWVIDIILLCRGRMKDGSGKRVQRS
jgi:TM2 domain-containing membrane protein YozV